MSKWYLPDFGSHLGYLVIGRPHSSKKKGDLVLYSGDLFPTEARKPPSCPLVKPKIDFYCGGFYLSETTQR